MSLPETGKVLHKTGKELPVVPDQDQRVIYTEAIAKSLRQALAAPGMSTKTVMGWTFASERTVKGWIAGTNGPRGEHLVSLMRSSDLVFGEVLALVGRATLFDEATAAALRDPLRALNEIAGRLGL
jgi:hypothetical protein